MNAELADRLSMLRSDYASVAGNPFENFFCPMLLRDEETPLCRAHLVNQKFSNATRIWTVQRKDVDSFYGSLVESSFTKLELARSWEEFDALTDRSVREQLRPTIRVGGKPVAFFVPNGPVPNDCTALELRNGDEHHTIALKLSEADLSELNGADWDVGIELDLQLPALVSLVKSAFLTAFHIGGYAYALSPAGRLIGHDLLGCFFRDTRRLPRLQQLSRVVETFSPLQRMVRPVVGNSAGFQGTAEDGRALICFSPRGFCWGAILHIRASDLHSVLIPMEGDQASLETYQTFIAGSEELLQVREARFRHDDSGGHWEVDRTLQTVCWPGSTGRDEDA